MAKRIGNVLDRFPVKPAATGRANGEMKVGSLEYQFRTEIIGTARLNPDTFGVKMNHIRVICKYLESINVQDVRSLKGIVKGEFDMAKGLVNYLQNVHISAKGDHYDVSTVYDTVGTAKWMHGIMRGSSLGEKWPTNKELGVYKTRQDTQNPVDFDRHPNYEVNRQALSAYLHEHAETWVAVAHDLGRAFGLRLSERLGTRGDTITRLEDGNLMLRPAIGKERIVRPADLVRRYGDESYRTREGNIKAGREYLIVEWGKGSLGRYSEVYTDGRRQALAAFQAACRASDNKQGRIMPDKKSPTKAEIRAAEKIEKKVKSGQGYSKFGVVKMLGNRLDYARTKLELKDYAYTSNGDRHRDVQRQIEDGRSDREIIIEKGHFSTDKLDHYRSKSK